jgi:hypothetical protein
MFLTSLAAWVLKRFYIYGWNKAFKSNFLFPCMQPLTETNCAHARNGTHAEGGLAARLVRWCGVGVGIFKPKTEPEQNLNRPNCRSIRVFGFGFDSYMCYISGYGFGFGS